MTPRPSPTARPLALLAAGLVLATAACGGSSDPGGSTPGPTVTVTASAPASSPAGVPGTSSPRVASAPASPPSAGGDGACTVDDLRVRYADDPGGAGAGNVEGTFTFTNRSSQACTLRGFPGVSFVTGTAGEQVGQAATRTDDEVTTTTLRAGGSAKASLRRSQPRNYGDACDETDVKGFRVYAPGDTGASFVSFPTTACKSANAPLLQVGPVR